MKAYGGSGWHSRYSCLACFPKVGLSDLVLLCVCVYHLPLLDNGAYSSTEGSAFQCRRSNWAQQWTFSSSFLSARGWTLSESELCYDRRSVAHSVSVSSLHLGRKPHFSYWHLRVFDERKGLSFTTAPGPRKRSHFCVTVSDSRLQLCRQVQIFLAYLPYFEKN
jgi:hypothetical protein